jgi:hypothetical protein
MITKLFSTTGPEKENNEARESQVTHAEVTEQPTASSDGPSPPDLAATGGTKMSQATDVYRRMTRKKGTTRKEIVAAFMEEVGLTKAGAATYYQMIKKSRR